MARVPHFVIEAGRGSLLDALREVWTHRELLYFLTWRDVPAPTRGELIRLFGQQLRLHKSDLGAVRWPLQQWVEFAEGIWEPRAEA